MHPKFIFDLFPPYPRKPQAFVAMSFADHFNERYKNVIRPALSEVSYRGEKLTPYRVNEGKRGAVITTEIIQEIADSAVIIGDITTIGWLDGKPIRNANVFYE